MKAIFFLFFFIFHFNITPLLLACFACRATVVNSLMLKIILIFFGSFKYFNTFTVLNLLNQLRFLFGKSLLIHFLLI